MLSSSCGFLRPRLQHFQGVTICDYVNGYEGLMRDKLFPDLSTVQWENKLFDLTVGDDILSNKFPLDVMRDHGVSAVTCIVKRSLEHVLTRADSESREAQEYLRKTLIQEGKTRIAVLAAHGGIKDGEWYYFENNVVVAPIQNWIDQQRRLPREQCPDAILLHSCNETYFVPVATGVPVLYAKGMVSYTGNFSYHVVHKK